MTSTYMTTSVTYGVTGNNNYHNFSTYGLNYFNESSEYSDGYQSSISPIASPDLSSCHVKNQQNFSQNGSSSYYHHHQQQYSHQQQSFNKFTHNIENYNKNNFYENQNCGNSQKSQNTHVHLAIGEKSLICDEKKSILMEKPLIVAPEVLKRRRVAANARERRRMNNLNFAFDR